MRSVVVLRDVSLIDVDAFSGAVSKNLVDAVHFGLRNLMVGVSIAAVVACDVHAVFLGFVVFDVVMCLFLLGFCADFRVFRAMMVLIFVFFGWWWCWRLDGVSDLVLIGRFLSCQCLCGGIEDGNSAEGI